jgi:tRNA-2-methylthio-N6-dimethylallyladenosine synthase
MTFYIETYGCQMNEYDSRMIASMLVGAGHVRSQDFRKADVVLVNTCSVRERAEARVLGRLRHLRGLMGDDAVLGVVGCVAQRMGDRLTRAVPGLDFVVGTDQYDRLPDVIERSRARTRRILTTVRPGECYDERPDPVEGLLCDFVSIMRGCDNFCSYCIVPYVRGRERSRPADAIVAEVATLARLGTRDVTLIGQNVNSYTDGEIDFAALLARVNRVPDVARVRFATSHPKDLSQAVIDAVAHLDRVCEHIHLPVQSGSDAVLRAMNRSYTRGEYVDLVGRIREAIPDLALTTDIIVGFPGESEGQYRETLSLMEKVRFDSAFMFRYSVRDGTAAAELVDDVPEATKIERLETVIALQKDTTGELNRGLVGSVLEVLVEGPSERDPSLLFGRTRTGKAVIAAGTPVSAGELAPVKITRASAWVLHGEFCHAQDAPEKDLAAPGAR